MLKGQHKKPWGLSQSGLMDSIHHPDIKYIHLCSVCFDKTYWLMEHVVGMLSILFTYKHMQNYQKDNLTVHCAISLIT